MSAPIARCRNHPSRDAMGICVRCGTLVCAECVTQVDGINHCVTCLAASVRGGAATPNGPRAAATTGAWTLALCVTLLGAAIWGILEATLPG